MKKSILASVVVLLCMSMFLSSCYIETRAYGPRGHYRGHHHHGGHRGHGHYR